MAGRFRTVAALGLLLSTLGLARPAMAATAPAWQSVDRVVTLTPGQGEAINNGQISGLAVTGIPANQDLRAATLTKAANGYEANLWFGAPLHLSRGLIISVEYFSPSGAQVLTALTADGKAVAESRQRRPCHPSDAGLLWGRFGLGHAGQRRTTQRTRDRLSQTHSSGERRRAVG
jgi:hypothetical protein